MLSWKEMVADKLSRLLADSRSASPSPFPAGSPMAPPEPQALFPEKFTLARKSSLSSLFLNAIRSKSPSFDENDPNLPNKMDTAVSSSHFSSYGGSTENGFSCKERLSKENKVETDFDETKVSKCNIVHVQERHINGSHELDETSMSLDSIGSPSYLTEKSIFMSVDLFEFFKSSLPNIVKDCQWVLLYRAVHGNMEHHSALSSGGVLVFQVHLC